MIRRSIFQTVLIAMLTVAAALPMMHAMAAIPCQELPVVEPDPDMAIPMIYIELPVTLEEAFGRGQEADRTDAIEIQDQEASATIQAAENQFRCLGYGQDVAFAGNSTPEGRVLFFAVPGVEPDTDYITLDSLYLVELGDPMVLGDGRFLIDFAAIVDGDQYLTGEFIFREIGDTLYLDGGSVQSAITLNEEPIVIEISTRFTREVKFVNASDGDKIVFQNLEEELNANIEILDAAGNNVFSGGVKGNMLVGGEDQNVFVVHDLEPGEYQITITFQGEAVTYTQTLVIADDGETDPEASPEVKN